MLHELSSKKSLNLDHFFQQSHAMFLKTINLVKLIQFSKIVFLGFHQLRLAFSPHCSHILCDYNL